MVEPSDEAKLVDEQMANLNTSDDTQTQSTASQSEEMDAARLQAKLEHDLKRMKDEDPTIRKAEIDENGMKSYVVYGSRFNVPAKYDIIEPVGTGAYGIVVAAVD